MDEAHRVARLKEHHVLMRCRQGSFTSANRQAAGTSTMMSVQHWLLRLKVRLFE